MKDTNLIGPKDDNTREAMQAIARSVDELLPNGWGFVVLAFPFGAEPGRLNYVANGDRADIIKTVEEWLAHAKRRGFCTHE